MSFPPIAYPRGRTDVAIVTMRHGKANTIDLEFLECLRGALRELLDSDACAAILTGDGRIFSAGVDLIRLRDSGPDYARLLVRSMDEAFLALAQFPRPLVAAVNGPAIAGGCVIACGCDYRVVSSTDGSMGLTELLVGVPLPTSALEIFRETVGTTLARRLLYSGSIIEPQEAVAMGLADEIAEPTDLMDRAVTRASALGSVPRRTFDMTKRQLGRPPIQAVTCIDSDGESPVADIWATDEIRDSVTTYADERLSRRRS